MKKQLLLLMMMLLPMVASINANAHDFEAVNAEGKTIYYIYNNGSSGTTVSVSYQGSSYYSYSNEYSGDIVIPESVTYNGIVYSVTRIGSCASPLRCVASRSRPEWSARVRVLIWRSAAAGGCPARPRSEPGRNAPRCRGRCAWLPGAAFRSRRR